MLAIRKIFLIILLLISAGSLIFTAGYAYSVLTGAGQLSGPELKFAAEQLLFISLLLTAVLTVIFILLIFKSRNIGRDIDRLVNRSKLNPSAAESGLNSLGPLSRGLKALYRQINEVSAMRGLKLSALSAAAEFLAQNIDLPLLIIDVTGEIIYVSRGYTQKYNAEETSPAGQNISLLLGSINMKTVLSLLEKKHLPAEIEAGGSLYRWIPLYDRNNSISYIAVLPN